MGNDELRRILGRVLLASVPTLALTTACRTTGEATYVIASTPGADCRQVCEQLGGYGEQGSWRVAGVMECVDATQVVPRRPPDPDAAAADPSEAAEPAGAPVAVCRMRTQYTGGIGRRPEGLATSAARGASPEGAFFARVEHLERASIDAFRRLARELDAHGAPRALAGEARSAARDEARHARIAARWRAHHGGARIACDLAPREVRPLAAIARENAVEGCVHETWGATIAALQAELAPDATLRADLATIARDEAAHAALAWRVDAWAATRLSSSERRASSLARAAAAAALEDAIAADLEDLGERAARALGLPDRDTARLLVARTSEAFAWAART